MLFNAMVARSNRAGSLVFRSFRTHLIGRVSTAGPTSWQLAWLFPAMMKYDRFTGHPERPQPSNVLGR
jgi:hypothetical protein